MGIRDVDVGGMWPQESGKLSHSLNFRLLGLQDCKDVPDYTPALMADTKNSLSILAIPYQICTSLM